MRFRYLKDPLFVFCCGIYFANRIVFKPLSGAAFLHNHLNDLLCVPFWVPIMLAGLRRFGLRTHDGRPNASEIIVPLILWAVAFEIFLPTWGPLKDIAFADYRDVFFYTLGALIAALFWAKFYFRPHLSTNHASGRCAAPGKTLIQDLPAAASPCFPGGRSGQ